MGLDKVASLAATAAFLLLPSSFLHAAPRLRLSAATLGPISIATGANGGTQTIEAGNIGDGSLAPTLASSVSWIATSVGPQRACGTMPATQCYSLLITLNTATLPAGMSTGIVTVTAPGAVDAPQTITVTAQMGGPLPKDVHVAIGQGKSADFKFYTNKFLDKTVKTTADWVSVVLDGVGSYQFGVPYHLHVAPPSSMPLGDYSATAMLTGSGDSIDNKPIGIFIKVTDQPVGLLATTRVQMKLAQGAPDASSAVVLNNIGLGTLSISAVKVTDADWLTATPSGSVVALTFKVGSLAPGTYTGSLSLTTNSIMEVPDVPVELTVVPKGAPTITFNGVVDNAIFAAGEALTPGDIAVVLGDQLSFAPLTLGQAPPLATTVGGAQVLVNGSAAPMYYSSYGQLAFQVPYGLAANSDATVQILRDGQASNVVAAKIANRAPRLLLIGVGSYGAILNQDLSVPMPEGSFPGVNTHPAKAGDTLTLYAIGLGATSPSVTAGAPAPAAEPLARLATTPSVNLYLEDKPAVIVSPIFAGLSPNYAGLYQVNVTIPANAPKGTVNVTLGFPESASNPVQIVIQ